jgi:NAD+-dependent protein deacetylase SIR2
LFSRIQELYPNSVVKGSELFDANIIKDKSKLSIFYAFISKLQKLAEAAKPSPTHEFIRLLAHKGKLLRCYTQNIDNLEAKAGLQTNMDDPNVNVVQLHGSLANVFCPLCKVSTPITPKESAEFAKGESVPCQACVNKQSLRIASGKRSVSVGYVRPSIALYNEEHINGSCLSVVNIHLYFDC